MSAETGPEHATRAWEPPRRGMFAVAATAVAAVAAVGSVLAAWDLTPVTGGSMKTENAFVRGRTTVIAPQVSGYVVLVPAHDFKTVAAGEVLAKIDDRIYRARVEQARANLAAAVAALANSEQAHASRLAGLRGQGAGSASALAQLVRAEADMRRVDDLVSDGSVSMRERDQTAAALALARAQVGQSEASVDIARQDVRSVQVGRNGLKAQVDAARAQLELALIDLSNTVVRAPEPGQLGEVGVRLGQYVTNGTQLMAVVPHDRWIIANFKEAQTFGMKAGDRAAVSVDALGGRSFEGHVEQLAPAAGSEFAVIRPDNGTGNFVKVPQRIAVRIVLRPQELASTGLRPGMSVEASVYRGRPR